MPAELREKRQHGRFYTEGNPFVLKPFKEWVARYRLESRPILEPFAGKNGLIDALKEVSMARDFASFDIAPADRAVKARDTLAHFPVELGYDMCVTNPPWLARNSAKRRGLAFPETAYDDLYKHALSLCLTHCRYVAAIIPATFLQSGLFRERLDAVVFLHDQELFSDTDNPVCLALFSQDPEYTALWNDDERIGELARLEKLLPPKTSEKAKITFNDPHGTLGFVAFDNTREPSIQFVPGEELREYQVGFSSRMITRISGRFGNIEQLANRLNRDIAEFRESTEDVFLTPFKGLRKDGRYRRRMDYQLARDFIAKYVS